MIRSVTMARFRRFAFALALASVACVCGAQSEAPAADAGPASIALLLPSQKTVFAQAAEALRLGFFAASEARGGKGPKIQVLEVDDDVDQLYSALDGAQNRGVNLVVGPLPRASVNAVIDGGRAALPMVALNYPERDASAPPNLIAIGLSAEAEAQYVVRVALAEFLAARRVAGNGPRFVVLGGSSALERRVAQAYVQALRAAGEPPLQAEATEPVNEWVRRLDPGKVEAVFLALDARQAALVRARIPRELLIFGTSLLNIGATGGSPEMISLAHDLDGIRFVDMPWLIRPDARATADPRPATAMSVELARLFALGVDAYRIAERWGRGETRFTFDGMSGRLSVDRADGPRVERTPASAIYRNGAIEREEIGR